jgi:hypothetical protein
MSAPRPNPPKQRPTGQSFSRGQGHGPVFPPPPADYGRRSDAEPPSPIVISREECVLPSSCSPALSPMPAHCPAHRFRKFQVSHTALRTVCRCSTPRPVPRSVKFTPSLCRLAQYRDLPRSASRAEARTSPHPFMSRSSRCSLPPCVSDLVCALAWRVARRHGVWRAVAARRHLKARRSEL